jgi:chloramphenicol O-acetyltransferase
MLRLTEEQLQKFLSDFDGKRLDQMNLSTYHKVALNFFPDKKQVKDSRIEFTSQLNITAIYHTYEQFYKAAKGATFTAYLKWNLLKTMQDTPFNWRYINNQWYEFKNLPLEVSVRTQDNRQQILNFIYNVANMSWEDFAAKHSELRKGEAENALADISTLTEYPLYAIAYQIVGLHIPGMTSYKTTKKVQDSHQPWIVFSDPYTVSSASASASASAKQIILPLHLSISHASLSPHLAEKFIEKFLEIAKMSPPQHRAFSHRPDSMDFARQMAKI